MPFLRGLPTPPPIGGLPRFLRVRADQVVLLVSLFVAALAIRLPELLLVPRFEDEGLEVLWGLDIAAGRQMPLTGSDAYYGPLFSYLVAGAFRLFGVRVLLPRLMVAVFGALAVLATYALGCAVSNERAGLIAALFALTSPTLVIVTSHLGWSNSLTPFFSTLTLAWIYTGVSEGAAATLAVGGFLGGLTLQSHPLAWAPLAAITAWILCRPNLSSWLKQRAPGAALLGFLCGYGPMIWAIAVRRVPVLAVGQRSTYAYASLESFEGYSERLSDLLQLFLRMIEGGTNAIIPISGTAHLAMLVTCLLFLVGLAASWRRSGGFLPVVFLLSTLLLPMLTKRWAPRYLAFLLPVAYVCMGDVAARALDRLAALRSPGRGSRLVRRVGPVALAGLLAVLVVLPVFTISTTYRIWLEKGWTNQAFFDLSERLKNDRACTEGVFIENMDGIDKRGVDFWAWFDYQAIRYVLTLDACPPSVDSSQRLVELLSSRGKEAWLIIPGQSVRAFSELFDLHPVMKISPGPAPSPKVQIALYRAVPRQKSAARPPMTTPP